MAQKRTSRKKKQRVLKKKGEKTVGGVDVPFGRTPEQDSAIREARTPQDGANYALEKFKEGMTANKENMENSLNRIPNAIGNSKFVKEGKDFYNNKKEEYKKASEDLVERARNPIRSSQEEMKDLAAYNTDNPPPKTTNVLNTVKNAFDTPLFKKKEENGKKKKKRKIGNFEKKFAEAGEKVDKIAFDLDFDSSKSSDKAAIIKQTLIETVSNKSKILNDGVEQKINTEEGLKNANYSDAISVVVQPVENMFASLNRAASGKIDKDQGTKTTMVIETEVFPAQKEKIHTPLLKFLYDMILVPENDENFQKIVWSFIAKMNEKDLIRTDVPSGFKEIQEITYSNGNGNGNVQSGGSKRKKQRGGTLQLNGAPVQFEGIEKETLFYSILDNNVTEILADLQTMSGSSFPFSLLFFDLETIEEDWLQNSKNVDILLGFLKEKERGILVADPELEFKGTAGNKMVLRATFRLENGVYGIFVHNSVDELDTVLNLLDGMELVEVNEKEEGEVEKIVAPALNDVSSSPTGPPPGSPRSPPGSPPPVSINTNPTVDDSKITDAILKTAIRLVADSLKKKAPEEKDGREKAKKIGDAVLKTAVRLVGHILKEKATNDSTALVPYQKNAAIKNELVQISKETVEVLNQKDSTLVPMIEDIKKEGDVIKNYIQNNTNIFHIYESKESNSESSNELKKDIAELKTQNEQISKDLAALIVLINEFITNMNSQVIHMITDQKDIQNAITIQTTESGTQTQTPTLSEDDMKKVIEEFKQKSQAKMIALETKVETLQKAVQEKNLQSNVKDEQNKLLLQQNDELTKQLETEKENRQELEKSKSTTSIDTQTGPDQPFTDNNRPNNVPALKLTAENLQRNQNEPQTPTQNETQTAGNTPFDISEKGLTVGANKENHLHLDWDYIKHIKNEKANDHHFTGETDTFNALIRPQIIDERIHWNQQLLEMLNNLLDLKKLNSNSKNAEFEKHRQVVTNILNLSDSKPEEIPPSYNKFIVDNILYAVYTNTDITQTIKKDYSSIQHFFLYMRKNLNDYFAKINKDPKYFNDSKNVTEYLETIKDFHERITKKDGYNDKVLKLNQDNQEKIKIIQDKTVHTETGTTNAPLIHIKSEDSLNKPIHKKGKVVESPINKLSEIYSERKSEDINGKIKKELGEISNAYIFQKSSSNRLIDNETLSVGKLQLMQTNHLNKNISDTKSDRSSKATTNHDIEYTTIENYTLNDIETEVNNTKTKIVDILGKIEEYIPSQQATPITSQQVTPISTARSSEYGSTSNGLLSSASSRPTSSRTVESYEPRLGTKRKINLANTTTTRKKGKKNLK